ncbi:MAG: type II toxin-antitoxin system PemK/MazF family toxin [Undibacterium sp.]|nr:type II toxin-antitoxin system PemK/MazF family toxin [Opitutaceae bacterium]
MSTLTQSLIKEIKTAPESVPREVFDFLAFLKARKRGEGREKFIAICSDRLGRRLEHVGGRRGMARFVSGDVAVVPFPFTDPASAKIRPALVLAALTRCDIVPCQITSQSGGHPTAVSIQAGDFGPGGALPHDSFALPHRVVTANESCVRRSVGRLSPGKLNQVRGQVCAVIRQD